MKTFRISTQLSLARIGFTPILLGFLVVFSVGMGVAIYLKLHTVANDVSLFPVIFWQLAIWMPLFFTLLTFQFLIRKTQALSDKMQWIYLGIVAIFLIGLHFGWFYMVSSTISPYLQLPKTKYGVYPFFFIFWIMIDITLLSGLLIYLKMSIKASGETVRGKQDNTFYLKKGNKSYLLKPEEILWIAAEDYYVKFYTIQGQFLERKSLKALLTLLPHEQFIRIHRSTVVNISAITKLRTISQQKAEVSLRDGHTRVVSRTYLKTLKDILSSSHS